jgi:hypothetical protein
VEEVHAVAVLDEVFGQVVHDRGHPSPGLVPRYDDEDVHATMDLLESRTFGAPG